jgi:hypothetical protein
LANHYVDKQDVFENQLASSLAQSQFWVYINFLPPFLHLAFQERAPWCDFEVIKLILQAALINQLQDYYSLDQAEGSNKFKLTIKTLLIIGPRVAPPYPPRSENSDLVHL